jgi:hypothetical protein
MMKRLPLVRVTLVSRTDAIRKFERRSGPNDAS